MLEIPQSVQAEMIGHAILGLPDEACGLFAGAFGGDRVERFFPMTNAAKSSQIYELDGQEMMNVERTADDSGMAIIGVMHSHTHTMNYPSPTDVADAARFDPFGAWRFIIVSLQHADASLRSYHILEGQVTEERVRIVAS
ncbi:MAG: proteasome lid subunit RPN8/RPN11 [Candidatus Aldehydirespiratoraceae bacterium]